MGSKTRARELMAGGGRADRAGHHRARRGRRGARGRPRPRSAIPVACKAAGGGGGKGFRVANSEDELADAFEGAAREGEKFFSDPRVYLERYLEDPRHVEVQVLADSHGNVIHLGERDCSIQRRHQKLIEEAPAPHVDDEMRERIGKIATDAAAAVDYRAAGTVEGLQVGRRLLLPRDEHPRPGRALRDRDGHRARHRPRAGPDRRRRAAVDRPGGRRAVRGHAIECRINAEAAHKNFAPAPGRIDTYVEPAGPGVRVDSGLEAGSEVTPLYDPMVAKLITWDVDREKATARMLRALGEYGIEPLTTLIPFHQAILATEQWAQGGDLPRPRGGQEVAEVAWRRTEPAAPRRTAEADGAGELAERDLQGRGRRAPARRQGHRRRAPAGAGGGRGRGARRPPKREREVRRRRVGGHRGAGLAAAGHGPEGRGRARATRSRRGRSSASSRR